MEGNVAFGARSTLLPPVEVEFVYYVHPVGELARERLAKYLAALGLDPIQSGVLLLHDGKHRPVWRVDSGFLEALFGDRWSGDWVRLEFLSFRHPAGDPAGIIEYSMVARCALGRLSSGDKRALVRVIGRGKQPRKR